jgi:hypothetical protein
MGWFLLLCSPVGAREKVAVLDLLACDVDAAEALLLSQHVRDELHKHADVLTRADLYAALVQKGIETNACADEDCMAEIGRNAGVKWLVAGSVRLRGGKLRLEAQLYRVDQQHLLVVPKEKRRL